MKKTPLNHIHHQWNARMVDFGGWEMPVQYSGIIAEHQAVRTAAGLFDVSHMGEIEVRGGQAREFLQYVTTNDVNKLTDGQVQYTALCDEQGGVVDDLTLYRFNAEHFLLCVNAANIIKDLAWLESLAAAGSYPDLRLTDRSADYGLLALQGPQAAAILAELTDVNLDTLGYYHFTSGTVADMEVLISRTGYTGEDGFELYCPADATVSLWQALLEQGAPYGLIPCGLGARDTLRLEKGYALYGHEISADILPLEARLGWITKLNKGDFVGRAALLNIREQGVPRQLIGLKLTVPGVPRQNCPVLQDGRRVGFVTSGTSSPSLKQGIALALVDSQAAQRDDSWQIDIRGTVKTAEKTSLPFVK